MRKKKLLCSLLCLSLLCTLALPFVSYADTGFQTYKIMIQLKPVNGKINWIIDNPNSFESKAYVQENNSVTKTIMLSPGYNVLETSDSIGMFSIGWDDPATSAIRFDNAGRMWSLNGKPNDPTMGSLILRFPGGSYDASTVAYIRNEAVYSILGKAKQGHQFEKFTITSKTDVFDITEPSYQIVSNRALAITAYFSERINEPDGIPEGPPIQVVSQYAYLYGYSDTEAAPENPLTRQEAAALIHRLMKQNNARGNYEKPSAPSFADVSSDLWSFSAMEYMRYINAFEPAPYIHPASNATRADVARMIVHAMRIRTLNEEPLSFTDISEGDVSYYYMKAMVDAGFYIGFDDRTIQPEKEMSRAEFVTMYNRIIGRDHDSYDFTQDVDGNPVKTRFADLSIGYWGYADMVKASLSFTEKNGRFFVDYSKLIDRNELDEYTPQ